MNDESNVCMTCNIVWVPKEAYSAALAQIESLTREKAELDDERKAQQYLAITRGELIETLRIVIGAQDKTLQESVAKIGLQDGVVTSVELPKAIGTLRANYEYLVKQIDVMASDSYKWEAKVKALRAELDAATYTAFIDDPDALPPSVVKAAQDAICIEFGITGTAGYFKRIIAKILKSLITARSRGETGETK